MTDIDIRVARSTDVEPLRAIYNHYVESSPATFDVEPKTSADRAEWLSHYHETGPHRLIVGERGGVLIGYASSSPFRPKDAYRSSVEVSIYLAPECTGAGLGGALYRALFESLAGEPVHRAYAGITVPNAASEALHRRFGFSEVGVYDEVGFKFEQYWSVRWFEKRLV